MPRTKKSPFDVSPKGCDLKHKLAVRLSRLNEHCVTLPIGLQSWNHSFARPGRMAGVCAPRCRTRSLHRCFSSACQSTSDCRIAKLCFQLELRANLWVK